MKYRAIKFAINLAVAFSAISLLANPMAAAEHMATLKLKIQEWNRRIKIDPNNAELYVERGELYFLAEQYSHSIDDFTKSLALHPVSRIYVLRGQAYQNDGELEKAEADFEKAVSLDPKHLPAYECLAELQYQLHQYDKSCTNFTKVLKMDPTRVLLHGRRADVYLCLKRPKEALLDLSVLLKTSPRDSMGKIHANCARAYAQLQQYDKALENYSIALERAPVNIGYRKERAALYDKIGKPDLAKLDREQLNKDYADAYGNAPFREK